MFFRSNRHTVTRQFELEKRNDFVVHELGGHRARNQCGELMGTNSEVLLNLYDIQLISSPLRLDGENVVDSFPVHPDVKFVRLDLPDIRHRSPEMIL